MEIAIVMNFTDKEYLVLALKHYYIRWNIDFLVKDSECNKYAICKTKASGCKWKFQA